MGLFLTCTWSDDRWSVGSDTNVAPPRLTIAVHDSDVATVTYEPVSAGARGICYLGFEPRHYFDDPGASDPVDPEVEAAALAAWSKAHTGLDVDPRKLRDLLASPQGNEPEATFVEESVARLLTLLGLPMPEDLPDSLGDEADPGIAIPFTADNHQLLTDKGIDVAALLAFEEHLNRRPE